VAETRGSRFLWNLADNSRYGCNVLLAAHVAPLQFGFYEPYKGMRFLAVLKK